MPVFEYEGINARGKAVRGVVDAEGPRAARLALKRQGVFANRVTPVTRAERETARRRRFLPSRGISASELALLTRQLATLLDAGLPLVAALTGLLEQTENQTTRRILSQVRSGVNEGKAFHEVLGEHPGSFPPIYRNMVRSGEASGTLPVVLGRLADFLEESVAFRRRLQSALVYPLLMGFLGTGILWFLMAYVVPRVTRIFEDLHQALPVPTRVLLAVSGWLRAYWWIALAVALVGWVALRRYGRTPRGRRGLHRLLLRTPAVGRFLSTVAVSRFARTLGTLLSSGVELLTALEISKSVLGNAVLEAAVERARDEVREGRSLHQALRATGEFSPVVCQMVAVGEESGALPSLLLKVSDAFEARVEAAVATLTSLIEPLMILALGAAVGFVVLAILLPIFEMSQLVG
ncbi:type II secretion system inner membrane protein GspF [Deferrisoma sp.]